MTTVIDQGQRTADDIATGWLSGFEVTEAWFTFTTSVGRGTGLVRLAEEDGTKAWTLLTALQELDGHEEPRGPRRISGADHGVDPQRNS